MKPLIVFFFTVLIKNINAKSCGFVYEHESYVRSISRLTELAEKDLAIVRSINLLRPSIAEGSELWHAVDRYFEDFEPGNGFGVNTEDDDVNQVVVNPLSVYRLIRRHAALRGNIMDKGLLQSLLESLPTVPIVTQYDLDAITDRILGIHFNLGLNITQFAAGNISGTFTKVSVDSTHCLEIGTYALKKKKFGLAIDWLREARRLALEESSMNFKMTEDKILEAMKMHDQTWYEATDFDWAIDNLDLFIKPFFCLGCEISLDAPTLRTVFDGAFSGNDVRDVEINNWGLCGGRDLQTPLERSFLFCWLEYKVNLAYRIGPLKMEFLSRYPSIVLFHDSFARSDIEELKQAAHNLDSCNAPLARNISNEDAVLPEEAWLPETNAVSTRTSQKIEQMTRLSVLPVTSSEPTQVTSYTVGGRYDPHVDALNITEGRHGDRMATFMTYVNSVHKGGLTTFPAALASAEPTMGSSVFWFNTLSDGSPDYATFHAECPVVMGHKMVSTKWIRAYDQFLHMKCLLNPKDRYQIPVNGKILPVPWFLQKKYDYYDKAVRDHDEDDYSNSEEDEAEDPGTDPGPVTQFSALSVGGLKSLFVLEWIIYKKIRKLTAELNNATDSRLDSVEQYLRDYEESSGKLIMALDNPSNDAIGNISLQPLLSYRAVWRFIEYIQKWLANTTDNVHGEIFHKIKSTISSLYKPKDGPHPEELGKLGIAIHNFVVIYDFSPKDIAMGNINGRSVGVTLNAAQCLHIGMVFEKLSHHVSSLEWVDLAIEKIRLQSDSSVELDKAKDIFENITKTHDEEYPFTDGYEPFIYSKPLQLVNNSKERQPQGREIEKFFLNSPTVDAMWAYSRTCRGDYQQPEMEKSRLFCWLETETHPALKIMPTRAELLSRTYQVIQFHDVVPASILKWDQSQGEFFEAIAGEIASMDDFKVSIRSGANRRLKRMELAEMAERLTGMRIVRQAETTELTVYGPGNLYRQHHDTPGIDVWKGISRVATLMYYLSDMEYGGATAFSVIGLRVQPKRGSAILWFSSLSSGDVDIMSAHGGCPVIFGEKWVATQWIRYTPQWHMKCNMDPQKPLQLPINGKDMAESWNAQYAVVVPPCRMKYIWN